MDPDEPDHASLSQSIREILSIQTWDTDCHPDGPPPNSPVSPSSHSDHGTATEPPLNSTVPSRQSGCGLFHLPKEVRCDIWRELLVTTKVYISFTNCRLLMAQRGARRKVRSTKRVSWFDGKHIEYYGVLGDDDDGEEADVGTYFSPRRCHDDWAQYVMRNNSELQRPIKFRDSYHPRPHLNIFLACRRTREEAGYIFYTENCFTFCTCNQVYDYNAARDISAAHAACCFFQDRCPDTLREIKHIELHVMHWESMLPYNGGAYYMKASFPEPNVRMWLEMAVFIKSHMKIQRLNLNVGGWAPESFNYGGSGNYVMRETWHPEI